MFENIRRFTKRKPLDFGSSRKFDDLITLLKSEGLMRDGLLTVKGQIVLHGLGLLD